jgi:hypothetical protein
MAATCGFTGLRCSTGNKPQVSAGCDVSEGRVASYVHAGDHWSAEPRGSGDQASGLLN